MCKGEDMFLNYLKENNIITAEQIKNANEKMLSSRKLSFYTALKSITEIDQEAIVNAACDYYKFQKIKDPFKQEIDWINTTRLYPYQDITTGKCNINDVLEQRQFFVNTEKGITFLIKEPEDENIKNKLQTLIKTNIEYALITDSDLDILIEYKIKPKKYSIATHKSHALQEGMSNNGKFKSQVETMLDDLIETALERRTTDLRIVPINPAEAKVIFTIDGKNHEYATIDGTLLLNLRNIIKTRTKSSEKKDKIPIEGKMKVEHKGQIVDVRVNIVSSYNGFDFNFRFINKILLDLDDLGLSEENLKSYKHILGLTKGLVVISGPTGSGKTSLLYAGFRVALKSGFAVYAIEDPVEINLAGVTQVEVDEEQGLTKQVHFNSALRHRPDIVAFGEIRDSEDAKPAINFAHTGHPAHVTIHANDAVGVISRMVNMGIDPYVLGDTLAAIIAQRLVRRICTHCSMEYQLPKNHKWREMFGLGTDDIILKKSVGCVHCVGTGHYGQIAINEIILVGGEIRDAIQKQLPRADIEKILKGQNFQNYLSDGIDKALKGLISFEEIEPFVNDLL